MHREQNKKREKERRRERERERERERKREKEREWAREREKELEREKKRWYGVILYDERWCDIAWWEMVWYCMMIEWIEEFSEMKSSKVKKKIKSERRGEEWERIKEEKLR